MGVRCHCNDSDFCFCHCHFILNQVIQWCSIFALACIFYVVFNSNFTLITSFLSQYALELYDYIIEKKRQKVDLSVAWIHTWCKASSRCQKTMQIRFCLNFAWTDDKPGHITEAKMTSNYFSKHRLDFSL